MTNELKTQWHPAFCSAIRLELKEDSDYLEFCSEYNLNSKPLQIDLVIVKNLKEIEVKNEIGKLFRKHNIIEYKSPDDSMNVNTYLKVVAYACLYKTHEEHVDDIRLEEITITLVRAKKPLKLFKWFEKNNFLVKEKYPGIFYVSKEGSFPMQVVVSKDLSKSSQKWLTLLDNNLNHEEAKRAVFQMRNLSEESEKRHGDSVLQVIMQENESLFARVKEDDNMCEALRKLMEPEINEAIQTAVQEAVEQVTMEAMKEAMMEAKESALRFFENGASYELVRASITSLSDEELREIYEKAKNGQ